MSSKLVERCLNDFQRRCGKDGDTALELACYAAIPVALNPELLHFLRINFFFDPPKQLPYTVEFEFFSSGLCRVIDVELYEIEPETRNELLRRLMERNDALQRIQDVATLLWQYVEHHSPWGDRVELERSQQLTALHFLNPKKAQEWLNEANADHSQNGGGQEWFVAMRQEIQHLPKKPRDSPTPPTPQQLKQLRDALLSAFPERSSLEQLLYFEFKKNLNQITKDSNLNVIVFELIKTAVYEGWLEDLIDAARKENPRNSQLEVIASTLLSPSSTSASTSAPTAQSQLIQQRILILAANPIGTSQLRLDEELREIEQGLRAVRQQEQLEIKSALAVSFRDIYRAFLDFKPQIVHFSGHGAGQDGLVFTDETGEAKLVDAVALARLFKLFADQINCVVLNACYSEIQARAIAQHINYVVGMSQAVGDRAAIEFAVGFYNALWAGESIEFAYELGCTLIQIQGISEQLTPNLLKKQLDSQIITPKSVSVVNPPPNEVVEPRSTTNQQHDLDDDLSSDRPLNYTRLRDLLKAGNWKDADYETYLMMLKVNYTRLRDLLKVGNWEDADYETYLVMLKVVGRESDDWIRPEELLNFPCTDLRTIDQLWVKYSNGRFGFSVQKKIYLEVGGVPDVRLLGEAWDKFGDRVGWRVKEKWDFSSNVTFSTNAPQGHLPVTWYTTKLEDRVFSSLASRLVNCNL